MDYCSGDPDISAKASSVFFSVHDELNPTELILEILTSTVTIGDRTVAEKSTDLLA